MNRTIKKTLLHSLELFMVVIVGFLITKAFSLDDATTQLVIIVALGALVKFSRTVGLFPDLPNRD